MTQLTPETLKNLITAAQGTVCVSLLMPTHREGPTARQDRIRLKNLLRQAEAQLLDRGLRRTEVDGLLSPAEARVADDGFWKHQRDGLAIYLDENQAHEFRLTTAVEELCVVGKRFHVTPLLPSVFFNQPFNVLALSKDNVRLFASTRDEIRELDLEGVPRSLEDALGQELTGDTSFQWHTGTAPQRGRRNAMFFGQGSGADDVEPELRRYVHIIDRAIHPKLLDRNVPLVLAAVEKTAALYRQHSQHPNVLERWIDGNPDILSPEALRERAWALIEPHARAQQQQALELFGQMEDAGRASTDLQEVLRAVQEGRVGTLFVALDEHCWGDFDEANREVRLHHQRHPGDEDLLEQATESSLMNAAVVYALPKAQMPHHQPIAALYRF